MNTNFTFIKTEFPTIYSEAVEAERLALVSPKAAAVLCRSALETAVRWLYVHDPDLNEPYDTKLSSLMYEYSFKDLLKPAMFHEINNIRKIGNSAAHGNRVTQRESLTSLKYLFRFISYIAIYYAQDEPDIPEFNEAIIPTGNESEKTQAEIDKLETRLEEQKKTWLAERELLVKQIRESEELRTQVKEQQSKVKKRRESRAKVVVEESVIPLLVSEKETRRIYIDQLLKESGWINLKEGRDLEYELAGMPKVTNKSGIGYADYVLWADNGLPLAVIEAKSTMYDARKGRHQAELYADCLEQMHGQRPIIFYTNGFDSHIWDDTFYTDRKIDGFYSKDELQRLIDRRTDREDLRTFKINTEIAGRPYQMEAIQRIAENFCMADNNGNLTGRERQGLLVMATGSGKTRTSAAIVDMLTKCNWAKRVLFLADRNVLVTQAKNAFNEYLPHLSAIDLTKESEDNGTRLVFSTYPTIMNRIDSVKNRHERFYGVGHFDLIIIDEAHRTVYQKYRAIFEYFDSLLIGLTATPKKDIDRNTYGLFGIEDDNPTFSYELNTAVNDGYLVPFKVISVPLKFPREGIKYNDLSEEEKLEYEEKFYDPLTGEFPEEITGSALNSWLFNTDTVDKVLEFVMEKGIKVEGGDKLGKTIIFAKNHEHAVFIEKRFNKKYPEHNSKFMRVIDNYETKAHDLLKTFADVHEELDPQIAVSVDMMDTGVDAPRVVNLLFFKLVRSSSKFWQMIGRGTRLCPDLFAPDEDKTHFLLFDFCENFEFFDLHPDGVAGIGSASLSQKIFEAKLEVAMLIREKTDRNRDESELSEKYIDELYQQVKGFDKNRFVVKKELRYVVEFSDKVRWSNMSKGDLITIAQHLSPIVVPSRDDDELARRFDILILTFQMALLQGVSEIGKYANRIVSVSAALLKKNNIPEVAKHSELLQTLQSDLYWQGFNVHSLEEVRIALRELMKYLDKKDKKYVITHFEDELDLGNISVREGTGNYETMKSYRDRVESYIRKNKNHITIHKLNTNQPITQSDLLELENMLFDDTELGRRDEYKTEYGDQPLGVFIRSILGLDKNSANEAFADFLQTGTLKGDQITFINRIITYLTNNGVIDNSMLYEPPFTDINDEGISGVFDDEDVDKVIHILEVIHDNAVVA